MKKRNRTLIILSVVWLILGLGFLILGYILSGTDILAWFTSKWAMFVYTFLGVYLLVIIFMFVLPAIFDRL